MARLLPGRRGPALAALVAAVAALPGLWLPFLADDWVDRAAAEGGVTLTTPFGYVRPLVSLTYRLEARLAGGTPVIPHATNLALLAAAAALVTLAVRRYLEEPAVAAGAGLLFALHPYHVENAAWIAARPDLLYSVLLLASMASYDRWRSRLRGLPWVALILFAAALLAKEAAITLPPLLVAIGLLDARRRPASGEWWRGYAPFFAVGLAHFLVLRRAVLGGPGLAVLGRPSRHWVGNLFAFGAASILPVHTEILESRPRLWGAAAALAGGALLLAARRRGGRVPRLIWPLAAVFAILVGPAVISFQGRYLFMAGAASAAGLAVLLARAGPRVRAATLCLLVPGWLLASAQEWAGWLDAGRVSRRLIGDLVAASRRPGVGEIVVANMPHRVHGSPVAADFGAAVVLSGGRRVAVRAAAAIDYPDPGAETLDAPPVLAGEGAGRAAEVALRVPDVRFSRIVLPRPLAGQERVESGWATVDFEGAGRLRIRIPLVPGGGRAAYVWAGERLRPLLPESRPGGAGYDHGAGGFGSRSGPGPAPPGEREWRTPPPRA